jgi:transposase InsO family protein
MDERVTFIVECLRGELSMSELCRKYEISRKTGYKWVGRFGEGGKPSLADQSRARLTHPNAIAEEIVALLVDARKRHPTWGPRKLLFELERKYPRLRLPASSTAGTILKRQGLIRPRRARRKAPPYTEPFVGCDAPNAVWCADFKGSFALGNGRSCNPLTISDAYSRYLLRCEGMSRTDQSQVRPIFESAFCEFGRPLAIRTDNGPPFATVAAGGLSRLAIWWIKLGIRPERIAPGKPQQNGRHERMHRTLKQDTTKPPARTLAEQQLRFDRFRRVYNDDRPHEALDMQPPWTVYEASSRHYPVKLREPEYPASFSVRSVNHKGLLNWKGTMIYLAETLANEHVALEEIDDETWRVYFADVLLGVIDNTRFHREDASWPSRSSWAKGPKAEHKVSPMCPV